MTASYEFMGTYGQNPTTTAKIICNKIVYAFVRSVMRPPPNGWLHSRWHWFRSPFSLRDQILWSRPLGAWFYVEDEISIENMLHMPTYEPVSWVKPEPGHIFLDVGAHIGWYTIQVAKAVGRSGRVIALEPDERNRQQLERNLSLNGITNPTIIPLAAWSQSGPVHWSPSKVSVWHKIDETHGSRTIQAVTLDDLVSKLALPRVDWIKMDVEGAEIRVLEGARGLLRRFKPALFIEVHETLEPLTRFLAEFGYVIQQAAFDQLPDHHGWIVARVR